MTIAISPLQAIEDLRAAVDLQQAIVGERDPSIWRLPHLFHAQQSGGLLLGARTGFSQDTGSLDGVLVDLLAVMDGYSACRTVVWGVCPKARSCGIGTKLRLIERTTLQKEAIDLAYWDIDPLDGIELHVALNKLGGILTGYSRDSLGSTRDSRAPGLATDRVRCEWWIDAPSVIDRLDNEHAPPHQRIGLQAMTVLTKTTTLASGVRGIIECDLSPTAEHLLAEIPEDFNALQARDRDAAIQWRLQGRNLIEQLFQLGYIGIGLMHEGGRSFLLFKKGTRRTELGAVQK
ncbi:hypothetical protein KKG90_00360 [Candidatus Bipolaricaulota bacterium]|nr:hypothetical protein [Candidatus Bipolaricaulota bacterium]